MNDSIGIAEVKPGLMFNTAGAEKAIEPVILTICGAMHTDMIFLIGAYPAFPSSLGIEYDLLVLVDSGYKKPMHEFESLIANRCHDLAMVTASVYKTETVRQLLNRGNVFFSSLCKENNLVYAGKNILLPDNNTLCIPVNTGVLETGFSWQHARAQGFFSGAMGYCKSGNNQLSAFMLHQAVEQGLNAFLGPLMGYSLQTHNLSKLLIYARRLSKKLYALFPRNTDAEIRLFQTLYRAYIYGRYKNNFQIAKEELLILVERVTELLEMTRVIFFEKVDGLKNGKNEFL